MLLPIAVEDVRREVRILQALSGHENVVQFYNAFEDDDYVYIVMEWFSTISRPTLLLQGLIEDILLAGHIIYITFQDIHVLYNSELSIPNLSKGTVALSLA
ncbi:hypothetical protein KI387_020217, partial [Taxus chinensis]